MKREDLTGRKFGMLTVLELDDAPVKHGNVKWKCKCDCGENVIHFGNGLRSGKTLSCGCLKPREYSKYPLKHGHVKENKKTSEYNCWSGMIQRCTNKKSNRYYNYGGRGITVCERWFSFDNFINDMGLKPHKGLSLDRINNDLGYSKENCRWATNFEQSVNMGMRSNNTSGTTGVYLIKPTGKYSAMISINGKSKSLGHYIDIEDAIKARKEAEIKYYRRPS